MFQTLEDRYSHAECFTHFNMGIGMIVIVRLEDVDIALEQMKDTVILGEVSKADNPKVIVPAPVIGEPESTSIPSDFEFLISKLKNTKNNSDFFESMNKSAN